MKCPVCEERTKVTSSWFLKTSQVRRRKHECPECLTEFTTNEIMDIDSIPVYIKDKHKIERRQMVSQNIWSDEELKILKEGLDQGLEYRQIAKQLPDRTVRSLQIQANKKGWSKKDAEYVKFMKIAKERGISRRLYYDRVKNKHWKPERAATEPNNRQKVIS